MNMKVYKTSHNLNDEQFAYVIKLDESNKYLTLGTKNLVYHEDYEPGNVVELSRDVIEPTDLKVEDFEISKTFLFKYFLEKKSNRNVRNILPQMVRIAGNTVLTNELAHLLSKQLDLKTFKDFTLWLKSIENKMIQAERNFKRYF